jgi:NAD(P)-dependent dehydrogenase (short-subunit alcohol dehydrogenase family)
MDRGQLGREGMGRLSNKVAIITGGASGFGRGACELWAKEGAKIVTCDVNVAEGEAVAKHIRSDGGEIIFLEGDVSKTDDARKIVNKAVEAFGGLDILYNNAGILGPRGVPLINFTEKDARRLLEVNFMGTFLPTKFALPEMIKRGGGSVISTSSESAFRGNGGFCVYGPTKAAVMNFSMVVAMEYADKGIRSNTVSPGAARTAMHNDLYDGKSDLFERVEAMIPMRRAATAEDVAKAALYFASDDSKYITGANLVVDGGWLAKGYF